MTQGLIRIRGARQHNLKNLNLDIRTGELTVVTGPSGSGKSSLVFDTLYAEGQRRYVETFSAYARQFLDRMDRPAVDSVDGVPPAIAIDQSNPVRSSRSTVGTMTELNDHLKLLFARAAVLFDRQTAQRVQHESAASIYAQLLALAGQDEARWVITFALELPSNSSVEDVTQWLSISGFTKIYAERERAPATVDNGANGKKTAKNTKSAKAAKTLSTKNAHASGGAAVVNRKVLDVVVDRFRLPSAESARVIEALEVALKQGKGQLRAHRLSETSGANDSRSADSASANAAAQMWQFSSGLHCPESDLHYAEPTPAVFSFNSAAGACACCRGFGRVIGVDYGLVIPNPSLSLREGAIKPIQTPAWREAQDDLIRHALVAGIPCDIPWHKLTIEQQNWVIDGVPDFKESQWNAKWFGVKRFFTYLESKAYKMHIRVLLSKYRSYTECPVCAGARLNSASLLWRLGSKAQADAVLAPEQRFMPADVAWTRAQLQALPGLCLHDLMRLPLSRLHQFCSALWQQTQALLASSNTPEVAEAQASQDLGNAKALQFLLEEISQRLAYLNDVGIGYLTLDRQSRTLSGGEVQRINLTTALGTSLVNTLFVLDEPSIGLHPRDIHRITQAMLRLRDAGNTLVVVEHDPAVMWVADRMIDMGPAPGERGGEIVFDGSTAQLLHAATLTGDYLSGRKHIDLAAQRTVSDATPRLILEGVRENNLKNITLELPLQRMVCLTGVSGSGKSSLVQDVLAPALMRHFGKTSERAGLFSRLLGVAQLSDVAFVDQSPIGKTARSNPASYVGAWDALRAIFASAPLSQERAYTASKFSFNSGDGRCPTCGGSGFEHVEMQFLSDVYLRCPDCNGLRYRPEILEVTITRDNRQLNVADVLGLTVSEAITYFAQDREVLRTLQPLVDVGLEYVKLGQPVPTLSGGEAQRLKLAGFLGEATKAATASRQAVAKKGMLFLFDEPTTGLHFDDIAKLMRALRRLVDAGHSLLVIEHNLDVIRASDWIIDLGPEGGEAGGFVVASGSPEQLQAHPASHTGQALRDYAQAMQQGANTAALVGHAKADMHTPFEVREPSAVYAATPTAAARFVPQIAGASTQISAPSCIQIIHAKEHNLKNISVNIPRDCFTVITGVSGSGKSTLAFDILFNEGQRRYLESLNAYARSIVQPAGRPEVDAVYGIPPTVAIEQRLSRGGRKSTVGTTTEVWHFVRLLYVKLGVQHCIHDGTAVQAQTPERIAAQLLQQFSGQHIGILAPLVRGRKGIYTDLAAWALARGYTHLRVDGEFLTTANFPRIDRFKEHTIELPVFSLDVTPANEADLRSALAVALEHGKGTVHILSQLEPLLAAMQAATSTATIGHLQVFSTHRNCPVCDTSYAELDPRLFSYNSKHGWCPDCVGTGLALTKAQRKVLDDSVRDDTDKREQTFAEPDVADLAETACSTCSGSRLNAVARAVRFADTRITELGSMDITALRNWLEHLHLQGREAGIAQDLVPEIKSRLSFLEAVGLGYLTLDRAAPTLSGGEAQRIRLAAQLGSNLQGVCYVLDEPTIGLHPRDNHILLNALHQLSTKGNTLVVVEHDEDTIRRADHIIDIGPSAGLRGGNVVAQGSVADICQVEASVTGRYLRQAMQHPLRLRRPVLEEAPAVTSSKRSVKVAVNSNPNLNSSASADTQALQWLKVHCANLHNLQQLDVDIPLRRLVAITGVSGSGKSTLARDVLLTNVQAVVTQRSTKAGRDAQAAGQLPDWLGCKNLTGHEGIDRVLEVDQTPIGKTPRSCPATYIGFWDTIRKLFAETLEAKARGYTASRFSFNTGEGRCPSCEGQGMRTIEMSFLPDVKVACETCRGARFNAETLAVTWRGKSIGEVLQMEIDDAVDFFAAMPSISHPLQLLKEVGLGYLTLGQPSPTLSGGEAQRVKLVTELSKVRDDIGKRGQKPPHTLYVLDEPTVGLHMADVEKLIHVLHRLVDAGHSVLVIEHDLDVIAEADWVLDLGPEGGFAGGRMVAATTPEALARMNSHTGLALARVLMRKSAVQ